MYMLRSSLPSSEYHTEMCTPSKQYEICKDTKQQNHLTVVTKPDVRGTGDSVFPYGMVEGGQWTV